MVWMMRLSATAGATTASALITRLLAAPTALPSVLYTTDRAPPACAERPAKGDRGRGAHAQRHAQKDKQMGKAGRID